MPQNALIERLVERLQLRAASFIVTVYGDVVVPRGEVLWMGSLIEICNSVGISENLVRTATSRLVSAGRLEGERIGRRSFYRLANAARTEFAETAHLLYAREATPRRWLVLHTPQITQDAIRRKRMGRLAGDVWLFPDWGLDQESAVPNASMTLEVTAPLTSADSSVAAGMWDLDDLHARYTAMIEIFSPISNGVESDKSLTNADALICRLLLVHVYRSVLLRDPCLPAAVLPSDWLGAEARQLFSSLYVKLSPAADAQIGRALEDVDGPLAVRTAGTDARLRALR